MLEWFWDYSDTVIPLLSIVSFVVFKRWHRQDWSLIVYSIACVFLFGFSNYLADRGINNMYLYHIFSLFEFIVVMFYALFLFASRKLRRFLLGVAIFYFIYWNVNIGLWESLLEFNSNSASIACLLIIIVCGLYFLSLNDKKELLYFQKLPSFWIMSGFLFYCACSIPVVLAYKYKEIFYDLNINDAWKIQVLGNCVKFVAISYAALCSYKYQGGSS